MKKLRRLVSESIVGAIWAAMVLSSQCVFAGPLEFSLVLIPAVGAISALPGSTTGWGYSMVNQDPDHWLATSGLSAESFSYGVGDASYFDFPVLAPLASATRPFNSIAFEGLFAFTWDQNAPLDFVNSGQFTVTVDFFDGDPFTPGVSFAGSSERTAAYAVSAAAPQDVPEPSFWGLLLTLGMLGLLLKGKRRSAPVFFLLLLSSRAHATVPGLPQAVPDSLATREDAPVSFDPLENDSGPLQPWSVSILVPPLKGVAEVNPVTGWITYRPNKGVNGNDVFTYRACDSAPTCSLAQVNVKIKLIGDYRLQFNRLNPDLSSHALWSMNPEGTQIQSLGPNLTGNLCAISPDGTLLACGLRVCEREGVICVTAFGNNIVLIDTIRTISWSPSGSEVVFESLDAVSGATVFTYAIPKLLGRLNPLLHPELKAATYPRNLETLPVNCVDPSWGPNGILCSNFRTIPPEDPAPRGVYRVFPGSRPSLVFENQDAGYPSEAGDGRIAYASRVVCTGCGSIGLYVPGAGSGIIRLTGVGVRSHPRWSPDSRKLSYSLADGPGYSVETINADGSNPLRILHMNDVDPSTVPWGVRAEVAWEQQPTAPPLLPSRPGGHILFTYSYHSSEANFASASFLPQLHRISPNASGFTDYLANASLFQFSVGGNPIIGALDARFSSDGNRIAYVANRLYDTSQFIVVMNPDGSGKQLRSPRPYVSHLDWSPDGRQIVFTGAEFVNFERGRNKLWLMNADGTNVRQLADLGRGTDPNFSLADIQLSFPSWSPDGAWIAFAASGGIPRSRWIVRADGTAPPVSVVADAGFDDRVAWSPSGTKVAFTRNSRIHVADFTPSPVPRFDNIRRLTGLIVTGDNLALIDERHPLWSPDGLSIVYSSPLGLPEGTGRNLWVVNSDGTLPLSITSKLGTAVPASWARISTRFDATPPTVTPPPNLTIPATDVLGARASTSPALFAFLRGGSATDNEDPSPVRLTPQIGGVDVLDTRLFPLGTTAVTFRFQDVSGIIGSAPASVTVILGRPAISGTVIAKDNQGLRP